MITRNKFYQQYCLRCGTQRCPMDDDAIASCGYYENNIEGIAKKEQFNLFKLTDTQSAKVL